MVGVKGRVLYVLSASNGVTTPRCFIESDSDHQTLTLGGVTNSPPAAGLAGATFNFLMPLGGSERGRNVSSRWIQVEFTGGLPTGLVTRTVKVPVFRVDRYNAWAVGASGTYLGLPVVVRRKFSGRPSPSGAF
jgi:hypothetical protein